MIRSKYLKNLIAALVCLVILSATVLPIGAINDPNVIHHEAALVYCVEADEILWSKNADRVLYPAALTKLMTALLAIEHSQNGGPSLDDYITASTSAVKASSGNTINIKVGEKITLRDLIEAVIHVGANDAANVIAEEVSGSISAFVELMNKRAKELGMKKTFYTNPTGLHHDDMVTTASDQLLLARHAARTLYMTEICQTERIVIDATNKSAARAYISRNYLISRRVSEDYYLSIANGMICGSTTEAGFCVIGSAQNDGLNYISVVLGSDYSTVMVSPEYTETDEDGNEITVPAQYKTVINGFVETAALLKWADESFDYYKAVDTSDVVCEIEVRLAKSVDSTPLLPTAPIEIFLPIDANKEDIELEWVLYRPYLTAPVKAGSEAGKVSVKYKGEKIGEVPLTVKTNIEASGALTVMERAMQLASSPFFKIVIIIIAVGAVVYVFVNAIVRERKKAEARREFIRKNRYLKG